MKGACSCNPVRLCCRKHLALRLAQTWRPSSIEDHYRIERGYSLSDSHDCDMLRSRGGCCVEEGLSSFFLKSHGSKSRIVVCGANARATLSEPAFEICLDPRLCQTPRPPRYITNITTGLSINLKRRIWPSARINVLVCFIWFSSHILAITRIQTRNYHAFIVNYLQS